MSYADGGGANSPLNWSIADIGLREQVEGATKWDTDNKAAAYAVRHWLERVRKKTKKSVKHWLITELGHKGTERIHLHGIIWTKDSELIKKWGYGYVWDVS